MTEKSLEHIAFIMDGNGRWAKKRGLPRNVGHQKGAQVLIDIAKAVKELGVKYVTVYAFSTENWKRSEEEVNALMTLLEGYLNDFTKDADTENIVIRVLGNLSQLSEKLQESIKSAIDRTKNNTGIIFNIALNYGGRDEITNAIKNISLDVKNGNLSVDDISEELVSKYLYTKDDPDPDLLIRTSGEIRLSGFLPWQSTYSEFLFLDKLWPDFSEEDLDEAIEVFSKRNRKFGAK